jgi:hypothetical protein
MILLCLAIIAFCIIATIATLIAWGIVTVINIIKEE